MTQEELNNRIKEVFNEYYWDLGIFRWANRNKNPIKASFAAALILALYWSYIYSPWFIAVWAFAFIGIITIVGIDHFIIGLRFKKILNKLKEEGIVIGLRTMLHKCDDILPK